MERERENRIENAILEWRKREERYNSLFGFNVSSNKLILRDKLIYYDKIANKFSGTNSIEEKYALKLLNQERKNLEKRLYPNRIIRLLRRLMVRVIWTRITVRSDERNTRNQMQELQGRIGRFGFSVDDDTLRNQIKTDSPSFSIDVPSRYVSEHERMNYSLMFNKDETGRYRFEGYNAVLRDDKNPEQEKSHFFRVDQQNHFDGNEAYNLLSGRAIMKDGSWMKLDLNDKNAAGEFAMREYGGKYGYDLDKVISELPLKNEGELSCFRLKSNLERGARERVSFLREGKEQAFYIEADPHARSVTIYDEHSKKITLNSIKGGVQQRQVMTVVNNANEQQVVKKSGRNAMKLN